MAIALDVVAGADSGSTGVSSLTWSHTVGSGSNRLLIATVVTAPPTMARITGMTYGGTAMTYLTRAIAGDGVNTGRGIDIYYMVNPPSGTANVVVSAADTTALLVGNSGSWTGVNQVMPFGAVSTPFTSTSATTGSVTTTGSTSSDLVVAFAAVRSTGTITYGGSQTQLWNHAGAGNGVNVINIASSQAGGTSITSTVTQSAAASSFVLLAVPILADFPTQVLTVSAEGTTTSGWGAEGGDYTRVQSDDGDATRLYTPTVNDVREFNLTDTSGLSSATINSLTIYAKVRCQAAYSSTNQLGVRVSGTDYWSSNLTFGGTVYGYIYNTWTTNPATSAAWTSSDLDAVQAAIKKTDSLGTGLTYLYAVVAYTASTGSTITKTQTAIARIATNSTKTQPSIARIAKNLTKTQPATSRISKSFTKTQPSIARVATNRTLTQTATARINANLAGVKTQPATARIATNRATTQTAKARIARNVTKTQPAIARISKTFTRTQPSTARIAKLVTKTQTATATITVTTQSAKTQPAISRIAINRTTTQSSVARIALKRNLTQTATARIGFTGTKTQTATSRISKTFARTQSATSRVAVIRTATQRATASIFVPVVIERITPLTLAAHPITSLTLQQHVTQLTAVQPKVTSLTLAAPAVTPLTLQQRITPLTLVQPAPMQLTLVTRGTSLTLH